MWNPSTYECNKACKSDEYLTTKNFSCKKRLIGKLVLECEDKILNTIETSLDDKKKYHTKKDSYLIHTILLVTICLFLTIVIFISCYCYYTRD